MTTANNNPVSALLQQALSLSEKSVGIPVIIDYDVIVKAVIKALRDERERIASNPKVIITQNEAHNRYGKSVIWALRKRFFLYPCKFDLEEYYDDENNLVKRAKGVVYYRVVDIEKGIEEANVLKGIKSLRR